MGPSWSFAKHPLGICKPAERIPEGDAQLIVIIPERIVKELKMTAVSNGETLRMTALTELVPGNQTVTAAKRLKSFLLE